MHRPVYNEVYIVLKTDISFSVTSFLIRSKVLAFEAEKRENKAFSFSVTQCENLEELLQCVDMPRTTWQSNSAFNQHFESS